MPTILPRALRILVFTLPPAFEPGSYRSRHPNLAGLRRSELRQYWQRMGRRGGDNASTVGIWSCLLNCLQPSRSILEIGPFDRPVVELLRGSATRVDYADYLSTDDLVARARVIPGRNPETVPFVRYVLSNGGYQQINEKYDAVVSQHCLEHQPDLIAHLQQVAGLLHPHGVYMCSLPDRRRCFDRYLAPTNLVNVLAAHIEGRQKPVLESVLEHRCFTVQDWLAAPDPASQLPDHFRERLDRAALEFQSESYVDVHCWKFTSESLRQILKCLVSLDYLPASTRTRAYNFGNEFAMALAFSPEAHSAF